MLKKFLHKPLATKRIMHNLKLRKKKSMPQKKAHPTTSKKYPPLKRMDGLCLIEGVQSLLTINVIEYIYSRR